MGCAFESSEVIGSREAYKMGYPKECNICIQKGSSEIFNKTSIMETIFYLGREYF